MTFGGSKHALRCSHGISEDLRPLFSDFWQFRKFSDFLTPMSLSNFFEFFEKPLEKMLKNHRKLPFLGSKIESIALFHLRASKVFGKCFKLFRRVIEVGKSEKIIKIGPETAEISKKHPKNGLKQAKFGDFKIG